MPNMRIVENLNTSFIYFESILKVLVLLKINRLSTISDPRHKLNPSTMFTETAYY
jgi:hypothetical protein